VLIQRFCGTAKYAKKAIQAAEIFVPFTGDRSVQSAEQYSYAR
jgi:hypothetical protein